MSLTILQTIAVIFIPMAPLWARVVWLNGSLDKWWLLIPIFWGFPLSIVPAILMYFGYVKPGTSKIPPYDLWMLLPIAMKFISGILVDHIFPDSGFILGFMLPFIFQLVSNVIPLYYRSVANCGFQINTFTKAITDAFIQNGVADLCTFGIKFIPVIGWAFGLIGFIPVIGAIAEQIVWVIFYAGIYIIMNMLNENSSGYCSIPMFGNTTDILAAVFFFLASFGPAVFNAVMNPGSTALGVASSFI